MGSVKSFSWVKNIKHLFALWLVFTMGYANANESVHQHSDAQRMIISQAWARALPPVVPNGAVYLALHNTQSKQDKLLGVETTMAKRSMVHESYLEQGKVAMRHVDDLIIAGNSTMVFEPAGYHIMLLGLNDALIAGNSFELILHFQHAGTVKTTVMIKQQGEKMSGAHHKHH